jgi:catechol 2,3-dioxygenase-like lactoylglutathione lyase family enzyme
MLGNEELIAFAATTDPERAVEFYGGVLGLEVLERTPYACVFRARRTVLRIAVVDHVDPPPYTVLGWSVRDIEARVRELGEAGVPMLRYEGMDQDALCIWNSPAGARVAWFRDPDGHTLSLTQLPGRRSMFSS